MAKNEDINLLNTKSYLSPEVAAIERQVRLISYGALSLFLVVGLAVGLVYIFLRTQLASLDSQKKTLIATISSQNAKEGTFLSLKNHLPIINNAMQSQKHWGQMLTLVSRLGVYPQLISVSVNDQQEVLLKLLVGSIDDASQAVDTAIAMVQQKEIRSPKLVGLQLNKDGEFEISLSFTPVFTSL